MTKRPKGAGRIDGLRPLQMAECGLSRREAAKSALPGSFNWSMQHLPETARRVFRGCAHFGCAPDRLADERADTGAVVELVILALKCQPRKVIQGQPMDILIIDATRVAGDDRLADLLWETDPAIFSFSFDDLQVWRRLFSHEWNASRSTQQDDDRRSPEPLV